MAGSDRTHERAARDTGEALALRYARWDRGGADLVAEARGLLEWAAPGDATGALARSCIAVAETVAAWGGHPYHSATHHAEVATNATMLAGMGEKPVRGRDMLLLLCAALGHDLLFDPRAPHRPFLREAAAAGAVGSIMDSCGADAADRQAVATLVLATELSARPAVRAAAEGSAEGLPPCLAGLADPGMARLAATLSDADLLCSAGLSEEWTETMSRRLAAENGRDLAPEAVLRFLEHSVGDGFATEAGRWFDPNLERIKAGLRSSLPAPSRG